MKNIFGEQLTRLRQKKNLSQQDLAQKLYVSRQSISKWENNEVEPNIDKLISLSNIFDVELDYLITGKKQSKEILLEIHHLSKKFDKEILKDINLSIHSHERIALLGSNGSGKSTLAKIIVGETSSSSGYLVQHFNPRNDLSIMPQDNILLNSYQVEEQIALSASIQKEYNKNFLSELLSEYNLTEQKKVIISELSGGQKRRLSLLIALLKPIKLLILDEPTVGMDLESIDFFWKKLELVNTSVLTITHDFNQIDRYFDRVLLLKEGVIISDEQVSNIHSNNQTIEKWYRLKNK
ncbi:ABC transporter ATP-binding protein [Fructobacillus pseudoficulneus]|uniref:ABC transporter ATP-binding protein n=1 Tax=Fructobacillus pseudoficulneus TaxID=220714 RepID=A0A3F3H6I0_9LACO|nr:XRE family transcriptional regulator [Fructobacillus pseudoficulneus]GAP03380.1 ABC transporter ATP-binding protein [Fructobacillus pseudoficulneus]SEH43617.1 ABC-2 type transport system ATP-binding protein [Fructobacillus pseudoficulneus]